MSCDRLPDGSQSAYDQYMNDMEWNDEVESEWEEEIPKIRAGESEFFPAEKLYSALICGPTNFCDLQFEEFGLLLKDPDSTRIQEIQKEILALVEQVIEARREGFACWYAEGLRASAREAAYDEWQSDQRY